MVGISLGLSQPDLARELARNPYGNRGDYWFEEFRQAGGIGPPTPAEFSSLPGGMPERLVLSILESYATRHFPEILAPLDLQNRERP